MLASSSLFLRPLQLGVPSFGKALWLAFRHVLVLLLFILQSFPHEDFTPQIP